MALSQMAVLANIAVFFTTAIMAMCSTYNNHFPRFTSLQIFISSDDVFELQIDAAGTQYAADADSESAFETLIDGDQWMIYRNVETDVLHWDFVGLPSFQRTA